MQIAQRKAMFAKGDRVKWHGKNAVVEKITTNPEISVLKVGSKSFAVFDRDVKLLKTRKS